AILVRVNSRAGGAEGVDEETALIFTQSCAEADRFLRAFDDDAMRRVRAVFTTVGSDLLSHAGDFVEVKGVFPAEPAHADQHASLSAADVNLVFAGNGHERDAPE